MKIMNRWKGAQALVVCAAVGLAVVGAQPVQADFIQNETGISSPAHTITFGQGDYATGTSITDEYAGVTFSPNLYYYDVAGVYPQAPNIEDGFLTNFIPSPTVNPFSILFDAAQTDAAFAFVTNEGDSTFISFLDGLIVEAQTVDTTVGRPDNFYGFTNSLFDEIQVFPGGFENQMILDTVQLSVAPAANPVPEPGTWAMMGIGLVGMALVGRKKKLTAKAAL